MKLTDKIENVLQPILILDTWEDRYQYLINLGKTAPEFPELLKTDERLIKSCHYQTWIDLYEEDRRLYISGASNSIFINGFIHLLIKIYSKELIQDIHAESTPFLTLIGFQEMVNPQRGIGLLSIYNKIKNYIV